MKSSGSVGIGPGFGVGFWGVVSNEGIVAPRGGGVWGRGAGRGVADAVEGEVVGGTKDRASGRSSRGGGRGTGKG